MTMASHAAELDSRVAQGRKRLLVTGSRDWPLSVIVSTVIAHEWLQWGKPPLTLVHGGAKGVDTFAAESIDTAFVAEDGSKPFKIERHDALWDVHGKAAGFIRNAEMVALGADLCIAFVLNDSPGAMHCLDLAEKANIPCVVYRINDPRLVRVKRKANFT